MHRLFYGSGLTGGSLLHPNNRRLVHTNGPVQAASLPYHRPARRRTERCFARRAVCLHAHAAHRDPTPLPPPEPSWPGFAVWLSRFGFGRPRKPWPTCHCAWRCACTAANQVRRGTLGVLIHSRGLPEYSQRTPGVLTHSTGIPPRDDTQRGIRCCRQSASPLRSPACSSALVRLNDRMRGCRGSSCS
jgi:hypothetical protein